MEKVYYFKQNKYIRLKVNKVGEAFRASLAINKYYFNKKDDKYFEINFEVFHIYDYRDEAEALERAKEFLENELIEFQGKLGEMMLED